MQGLYCYQNLIEGAIKTKYSSKAIFICPSPQNPKTPKPQNPCSIFIYMAEFRRGLRKYNSQP